MPTHDLTLPTHSSRLRVRRRGELRAGERGRAVSAFEVMTALDGALRDVWLAESVMRLHATLTRNVDLQRHYRAPRPGELERAVQWLRGEFESGRLVALREEGVARKDAARSRTVGDAFSNPHFSPPASAPHPPPVEAPSSIEEETSFHDPDAHLEPGTAPPKNDVPTRTWFEVKIVDEGGVPIDELDVALTTGSETHKRKTNHTGVARWDEVDGSVGSVRVASEAIVRDKLRPRRGKMERAKAPVGPKVDTLSLGESELGASLHAEVPLTIVVALPLTRVRLIGMHFDTNKAFLRESAMNGIRKVVEVYQRFPKGKLLIVGHTDTKGSDQYNLDLSVERAEAIEAYLKDDVATWDAWFGVDRPSQKRWGNPEIHHMISALPCEQSVEGFQRFSNETRGTSLKLDGNAGPKTQRSLIEAYMALDGTTLPKGISTAIHGCGEFFPEDETEDGVEDVENRRVEIFCFDDEIAPPVPGKKAKKGEPEYEQWKKQVTRDIDFSVDDRVRLQITLLNDERSPRGHVPFELTVGGETLKSETDAHGQFDVLVAGGATTGTLVAGDQSYELRLRELSSLDTIAGVQERLDNLAYSCTPSGELDEETRESLKSFQRDESLAVTGEIDGATKARLKTRYGH